MPGAHTYLTFLVAALVLAAIPGPGLLYVLARSLRGGVAEGVSSSFGTFAGGLVHVLAAGVGVSALVAASATAFTIVKLVGALYLIALGIRTLLSRPHEEGVSVGPERGAFVQGAVVEALNPKTALFFLALIPQFVDPERGAVFAQFVVLGVTSVALNTAADLIVAGLAGRLSDRLRRSPAIERRLRRSSGVTLIGLGGYAAVAEQG